MLSDVERIYATSPKDLGFGAVLGACPANDDESLAELIEADGRLRLRKGKAVNLERYLTEVPDLPEHPDALDAAIDVTLRGLSGSARITPDAVESLVMRYPTLAETIREAATLNAAVWSTSGLRQRVTPPPARQMPCDFGPRLASGQRRYVLEKFLGQGSFGQVYQATDRQLSEEGHRAIVAIKVLADTTRTAADRQRLIEEATKVRRISHPNVVQVIDRGVSEDDEDFIVYEHVDGGDLSDLRDEQVPLEPREAAALVMRIARGVHAAHSAGVIHCDLKPSNIMRTAAGEPKVADFGIAVRLQDRASAAATPGSGSRGPIGNIAFISPEQFRGEDAALSVPSDVYALGGILFYLLTARLPNGATRNEIAQTHDRARGRGEAPSPRAVIAQLDRDLDVICRRALAPQPQDRHPSAAMLAEDLERWLALRPIDWTRPSVPRRLRLWARRKPALAAAAAAIFTLAVAGVAVASHYAREADHNSMRAAIAQAHVDADAKIRAIQEHMRTTVVSQLTQIGDRQRFLTDMLIQVWVWEYIYGPQALGDPSTMQELWDRRVDGVRQVIAQRHEHRLGDTLETMLWEHALAFWLVSQRDDAEAVPLLKGLMHRRQQWDPDGNDPWFDDIHSLQLCAEVNRMCDSAVTRATASDRRTALEHLATTLREAALRIEQSHPRSPMHYLVLNRLADLNDPLGLDRPERAKGIRDEVAILLKTTQTQATGVAKEAQQTKAAVEAHQNQKPALPQP